MFTKLVIECPPRLASGCFLGSLQIKPSVAILCNVQDHNLTVLEMLNIPPGQPVGHAALRIISK